MDWFATRQGRVWFILAAIFSLLCLSFWSSPIDTSAVLRGRFRSSISSVKLPGQRIVGIVFYGRQSFVEILDCYLRRNLASNGGLLDEVLFLSDTNVASDLAWLQQLVDSVPEYRRIDVKPDKSKYLGQWAQFSEPETIYVKIDDDVVWIADDAIQSLTKNLIAHPEALAIGANIINSPITQWYHFRTGAIRPYLPDPLGGGEADSAAPNDEWRTTSPTLPYHSGPTNETYSAWQDDPSSNVTRMLPLPEGYDSLKKSPMYAVRYWQYHKGIPTPNWSHWTFAQQLHYSFLANLEENVLDRYWFGNKDGLWDLHNDHYNLNFMAIRGKDVPIDLFKQLKYGDEVSLTEHIPRMINRPFLMDGRALMVHYSYGRQRNLLTKTDVLSRYRALAKDRVCVSGMAGNDFGSGKGELS